MAQGSVVTYFVFNRAEYVLGDGSGKKVLLSVDYENDVFTVRPEGEPIDQKLRETAAQVARDLLQRKHGINFAEKIATRLNK